MLKNVCIIFTGLVLVIVNFSFPNKPLKRGKDIGKRIVICFLRFKHCLCN